MRSFLTALMAAIMAPVMVVAASGAAAAQAADSNGLDGAIDKIFAPFADVVSGLVFYSVPVFGTQLPLIVVWLVLGSVFCTFYFRFIAYRGFKQAIRLVRGDYSDPNDVGEVSHFQALATALSGTVGLGNIAGVAIAISIGGPGATFWMILGGLLGMSAKFAECTLAVKYRNEHADGTVSGGPMYTLSKGLAEKNMAGFGRILAVLFAVFCILASFGGGNMFQVNQAFQQFMMVTGGPEGYFGDKGWLFGLVLAVIIGVVIIGGIKSIAKVTEKVVPFMAVLYLLSASVILVLNYQAIPGAFSAIFLGAFSPEGVTGGVIGVLIQGFRRAAFSNEAGIGSAAIAHAAVRTKEPVTEGLVSLLEPFIDTVVICTMTALVIIVTGTYTTGSMDGVTITSNAFATASDWFPYLLAVAVILFAFSTMLSWSYYGVKSWTYLFGESRLSEVTYKALFCGFVVVGATMNLNSVVDFGDAMNFAMAVPNFIGIYILASVLRRELKSYMSRLESGEIRKFKDRNLAPENTG